jgi:lipoyl(octanoyl) transferase
MDPEMVMQPGGIEWRVGETPVEYAAAVEEMEGRVAAIGAGAASELVWLLEHPPLYTAGTSARDEELIEPGRLPVHRTGRGGRYTYHGPGQRIAYVVLDLRKRGQDVRCYVHQLEEWIIRTLARFEVRGERRDGRVGIWVVRPSGIEEKIAAIFSSFPEDRTTHMPTRPSRRSPRTSNRASVRMIHSSSWCT